MADHVWVRHGPWLACCGCGLIQRPDLTGKPCPRPASERPPPKAPEPPRPFHRIRHRFASPKPKHPTCAKCHLPLFDNDLECYLETGGEVNTHLTCT